MVVDAAGEIFGDVPNIAARAQALAEPGAVVVTARVQRQIAGLFVAEERGSYELKGVPEPVILYRLVRASGGGRRAGQRHLTPLIGRDEEIAMLMRRWERARRGEGQMVVIIGEPGLGKSRLIEEYHARLRETPHTWVEWSCSQLLQNTPLHPFAEWGRIRFGGADVPAEQRLADLESSLSQVRIDPEENVPLLAPLLDIPLPAERRSALPAEELRRRQLAGLIGWVSAGARVQPVVFVCEDVHWADPTTLDLLRGIAERSALAPLLVLITARPEFRASWSMRSHHGTISLSPLDHHQVRLMVAELAARHAVPNDLVDSVSERTGGVPLFVEEVTRLVLERGDQGGIQAIPLTLQQSLMARLDRLGPAREVAQVASVIGRDFSYALIRVVAGMEHLLLQAALERLAEADILLVQGLPPEADYRFKHSLIQDAAYENLLKSRRQLLHRMVGEALRDRFSEIANSEPAIVAHHFTQAGITEQAVEWWGRAGTRALSESAYSEAIAQFERALTLVELLSDSPAEKLLHLRLLVSYGNALIAARGYQVPEAGAAFARACDFAVGVDNDAEWYSAHYGKFLRNIGRGELALMKESAKEFLQHPRSRSVFTHQALGMVCWFQGEFADAKTHFEQALTTADDAAQERVVFHFAQSLHVGVLIYLAMSIWPLGEVDRARRIAEEALAQAVKDGNAHGTAFALGTRCTFELMRRDFACAALHSDALIQLARQHEMQLWLASAMFTNGWAHWHLGDRSAGEDGMRDAIALLRKQGKEQRSRLFAPLNALMMAEVEAGTGRTGAALSIADETLDRVERSGQHWFDAEVYRIRGEVLLKHQPLDLTAPEAAFMRAMEVAHSQRARTFELRAAMSLARLWRDQGKVQQARELLAPVYGWFTEGFDTRDLKEAKALLDELNA